jgi:glycosyltransferase involved in cell wall biosynthesis
LTRASIQLRQKSNVTLFEEFLPARTLSLIVPVHNAAATLDACLHSVFAAAFPAQVIVVDDASNDGTAQIAARFPCQVLALPNNVGAAAARNAGAQLATGDILFFLDGDIVMEHDTVARILDAFADDVTLAALFGSYQQDTVPKNFFSQYKNLLHHYTHQISATEAATFCSGYGAIRRQVFFALGGFNESQRALEDIEFGYRLHRAGHRIRLLKDLQFTHLRSYTFLELVRSDVLHRAIPWTRLMLESHIFRNDLNTKSNNVASVGISFLILFAPLWLWFVPFGGMILTGLMLAFLTLNFDFILFVTRARGSLFGLKTVAMSWFFYVYSGIGLLLGIGIFLQQKFFARA